MITKKIITIINSKSDLSVKCELTIDLFLNLRKNNNNDDIYQLMKFLYENKEKIEYAILKSGVISTCNINSKIENIRTNIDTFLKNNSKKS